MNKIAFQLGTHVGQTKSAGQGWNRFIQMLMGGAEKAEAAAGRTIPKGEKPLINAPRVGAALTSPVAGQVGSGLAKGFKYVVAPAVTLAGANELYKLGKGMPAAVAGAADKTQGAYRGPGK